MRLVVIAALVALGCGKRSEKPITCADAARASVDAMLKRVTAERTKLDALAPRLRSEFTRRCVDDDWRADAITCFAKVKTADDVLACKGKLASDQQAKLPGEDVELEIAAEPAAPTAPTAPTGSSDSEPEAPEQAPSPEDVVKLHDNLRALDEKLGEATMQATAAASPGEREAAQALVKELQTQRELLDKQLSGSREQELEKQLDELDKQLSPANAPP